MFIAMGTLQTYALWLGSVVATLTVGYSLVRLIRIGDKIVQGVSEYPPQKLQEMEKALTGNTKVLAELSESFVKLVITIYKDIELNTKAHGEICERLHALNHLGEKAP